MKRANRYYNRSKFNAFVGAGSSLRAFVVAQFIGLGLLLLASPPPAWAAKRFGVENDLIVNNNVGIGTTLPAGTLDVNGAIFQRGAQLHADYVFEPDYALESIEEHAEYMWQNKHLPAVPVASVDSSGQEMLEIGAHRRGILEELEKAHVYIQQLNGRIKALEAKLSKLEARE